MIMKIIGFGSCLSFIFSYLLCSHPEDIQLKALNEMFAKFVSEKHEDDTRLRLLEDFLVPMLCEASKPAVITFFADHVQFVIDRFEERLIQLDNYRKVKAKQKNNATVFY